MSCARTPSGVERSQAERRLPGGQREDDAAVRSRELARRLSTIFTPERDGRRPCHGEDLRFATDPHWKELVLFHEFFHGETGKGLGASHQTGWTALVTRCLEQLAK